MKFGIITCGSRGDIQPFLALAVALKQTGHEVKFISSENFKSFIESHEIEFISYRTNANELTQSESLIKCLHDKNGLGVIHQLHKIGVVTITEFRKIPIQLFEEFDFLISHIFLSPFVLSIAEKLNKKFGVVVLNLPGTPTKEFPYQPVSFINHSWYNRFSYKAIKLIWFVYKRFINQHRSEIGLQKTDMWPKFFKGNMLTIYPMSQSLIKQPSDWPSNSHVTGFLELPMKQNINDYYDPLPDGFEHWLSNGDKPIFIGFGSIPIPNPELIYRLIDTLTNSNQRVIFMLGWSKLKPLNSHSNLFIIKSVDHHWLFPQCKLAIIHGGIGTVASVLRAGIPMIILSILADQPYNGKMVANKRAAVHIPFSKITLKKLQNAIEKCQSDEFIANAKKLSSVINQENGVDEAIKLIEAYAIR